MRQEENVRFLEPHILSCCMGDDTRQDENVRFFEPHVLSPILWEYMTGRECEVLRTSRSLAVFREMVHERQRT